MRLMSHLSLSIVVVVPIHFLSSRYLACNVTYQASLATRGQDRVSLREDAKAGVTHLYFPEASKMVMLGSHYDRDTYAKTAFLMLTSRNKLDAPLS